MYCETWNHKSNRIYIYILHAVVLYFSLSGESCYCDDRLFRSADMDMVFIFSWIFHSRVWNSFNSLELQFLLKVVQSQRDFSITGAETQYAKKSCITGAKKQLHISNNDVNWISRKDVTHWSFGVRETWLETYFFSFRFFFSFNAFDILARSELQWLDRSCVSQTIMKLLWFDKRALDRCR